MPNEGVIIEPLVETLTTTQPATVADEQKTEPAPGADAQNTDTPEQQEAKKESRRQRAARRDRDALVAAETENRILKEQIAAKEKQAPAVEGEPKREDFEDYEGYQRAIARYEAKQVAREELKTHREATQGEQAKSRQSEAQQAAAKAWTEREAVVIKANPDYEKIVAEYADEDLGQLSDGARRLIVDSDVGPQVLLHLAKNPEVHERIAKLAPLRQVVELGKLEDSLPKAAEAKTTSSAPAPAKPGPQGRSSPSKDPEKMSQEEYMAFRKEQGARWAR